MNKAHSRRLKHMQTKTLLNMQAKEDQTSVAALLLEEPNDV